MLRQPLHLGSPHLSRALHSHSVADHGLRTTCWSLVDGSNTQLAVSPKYTDARGVVFTPDGVCVLILERKAGVDAVLVFSTTCWTKLACRWQAETNYTEELVCTATSEVVLWDVDAVCLHALDGLLLARFHDSSGGGIRACVCSPQRGGPIACLTHDHAMLLLEPNTLECLAVLPHTPIVRGPPSAVVYREEVAQSTPSSAVPGVRFMVSGFPVNISRPSAIGHSNSMPSKPSGGAATALSSCISWNRDGNVVAVRCETMPHCVWLWDIERLLLMSVLHLRGTVKSVSWEAEGGSRARLAVATGGRHIYMWSPEGASTVTVPMDEFKVGTAQWSAAGSLLMVLNASGDAFTVGFARPTAVGKPRFHP